MERCRTTPEVYGFEVVLKQAIISPLPESLKIRYSRMNARSVDSPACSMLPVRLTKDASEP